MISGITRKGYVQYSNARMAMQNIPLVWLNRIGGSASALDAPVGLYPRRPHILPRPVYPRTSMAHTPLRVPVRAPTLVLISGAKTTIGRALVGLAKTVQRAP